MTKLNCVKIVRKNYWDGTVSIEKVLVELLDEEIVNEITIFKNTCDVNVTDFLFENALQVVKERLSEYVSTSRERYEMAKRLARTLDIPLKVVNEDGTELTEINP